MKSPPSSPAPQHTVLLVEDDEKLRTMLATFLRPFGFRVLTAHDGSAGLSLLGSGGVDAVVLDVMLPGDNGLTVLEKMRKFSSIPILMYSAKGAEEDRIAGLDLGADDYIPKFFSPRELVSRLRAVLRRGASEQAAFRVGNWRTGRLRISERLRSVLLGDSPLNLTTVEFDLLMALVSARGEARSREQLYAEVSKRAVDLFNRSIDVHIHSLRKKLGDAPGEASHIRTLRYVGYQWALPVEEER